LFGGIASPVDSLCLALKQFLGQAKVVKFYR
jgi:hypothetical protein